LAEAVRSSYWLVPSVMAFLAVLLGVVMIWVDVEVGTSWMDEVSWYQQIKADGAREVLSTIAGSMITVAGVVFSITMVAISFASGQYGPRVLTNFMSDRGNKVTLGTFIATFLYCLVVLRTVRGGDETFVPQFSVVVALFLAVCSIGVLIYFIHHVPQSIHINNVAAKIGRQLVADAEKRFPSCIGEEGGRPQDEPTLQEGWGPAAPVRSHATGYIQAIATESLLRTACERDLVLRLHYRPGDFVVAGRTLLECVPAERLDEEAADALRGCFSTGALRTPAGDMNFLINELVEIAARALSPGVNDPFTAVTCMDWLGAGATEIAQRRLPSPVRKDEQGQARLIAQPDDFGLFVELSFARLRQYAAADMIAALHLLRVLGEVAISCPLEVQVRLLAAEARHLADLAEQQLDGACREEVRQRAAALQTLLSRPNDRRSAHHADWLDGSA